MKKRGKSPEPGTATSNAPPGAPPATASPCLAASKALAPGAAVAAGAAEEVAAPGMRLVGLKAAVAAVLSFCSSPQTPEVPGKAQGPIAGAAWRCCGCGCGVGSAGALHGGSVGLAGAAVAAASSSVARRSARLRSPDSFSKARTAASRDTPAAHKRRIFSSSADAGPELKGCCEAAAAPAPRRRNSATRSTSFRALQSSSIQAFVFARCPAHRADSAKAWTFCTLRRGTTSSRLTTLTTQSSRTPMSCQSTHAGVP
mmetsp:Transcript_40677/g.81995  ORF Transcript_40677/g.81995 Transcript_40677/m.81995 type:complete len:257 (+) Transcript_40677:584-1354(+)